jgi:ADP-heptose:LPS heptosyltransferase
LNQNSNKIKFLVIRFSSIGDIVLTTPVIRCLKQQLDNAEIHFVVKTGYTEIVESNPFISKIHVCKESLNRLIRVLKEEKFDYLIDLQNNLKSTIIKSCLGIPSFTVNKINFKKFLMVNFKIDRLPPVHVVDRYMDTLSFFNVKNDNKGLDYFIPGKDEFNQTGLPSSFRKGYIAVLTGASYNTKKLPAEKIAAICNKIEFPVILIGGKNDYAEAEKIMSEATGNIINFAGKIRLNQSASLVRKARLVLSNDTGMMHIAAAFKKKILSFWGNTIPEFGMYPYMPDPASKIMEIKDLRCRPCSKLGYRKCPKNHFKCMNMMDENEAVEWIKENFNT